MKPNLPGQLKCGESRRADKFDGGFLCSSQYAKPGRHLLACSGHIGIACFSPGEALRPPREKQAGCLFFYKMEGRENSLPGTELFDCADLYASIQGSDDRSQNRERFCFLRVLMTQNPVKGHLKSDRDILSLSSKFAVWISAAYLPVSGLSLPLSGLEDSFLSSVAVFSSSSTSDRT